ncbi:MAG TPA: peptidase M28, partial [Bacteroidetes bacterium]|nr:peptidase M28 [Bacteroidota bacterium]
WSHGYKRAAEWAKSKLVSMGLENSRIEGWEPMGRSWEIKHYSANVLGSQVFPLLSYPRAWSPGLDESGEVILFDAKTDSALDTYKGKLKGRFVLMGGTKEVDMKPAPSVSRYTDGELLELANADVPKQRRRRRRALEDTPEAKKRAALEYRKQLMVYEEGALATLTPGAYDGGSIQVMSASIPSHPDTPWTNRPNAWAPKAAKVLPQIVVAPEHYNRMARMLQKGEHLKLDLQLDVAFAKEDSGYNVIAELPGTDLKDEVVMIGAHLDSWHGGTGATDDGTGVAVCMEAMRILKATGLKPRRTIRIGLWGGEEQGLYGSRAYVKKYLGEGGARRGDSTESKVTFKPDAEKFSVYFNDDNGTGKFRGIYMERNESVRPIFRKWFVPFGKENEFTLTVFTTGGTDHQSFDGIGLPAFQFIQDDIEYFTKTWHSTMDVYDHTIADDLKQGATIMAGFAYNAAMRDEMIPRKPVRQ